MNSDLVALVSVLVTGAVALSTALVQPLLNRKMEKDRRSEEQRSATIAQIRSDSTAVLGHLAFFSSGQPGVAAKANTEQVYRDLLTTYYSWELTVWPYLTEQERDEVKRLRSEVEDSEYDPNVSRTHPRMSYPALLEQANDIARSVLDLARAAIDAVP